MELFFSPTDALEIALFISGFYLINRWLFSDKKLLIRWYGYHALLLVSFLADLSTLFFILACCFPLVLIVALIAHQERLQKTFVVAQKINALEITGTSSTWIDELIKFTLTQLHESKNIAVVIEHTDSLTSLINATHMIQSPLKKRTLELLYSSLSSAAEDFLWLNNTGMIIALNARWKNCSFLASNTITGRTDCIALYGCATTRRFTLMYQHHMLENLSAHHLLNLLYELHAHGMKGKNHGHSLSSATYNDTVLS